MDISIDKHIPVGIKDQIKKQILVEIGLGRLMPGERLLSAADLAGQLKINRNTVALVYKELENEGFLEIVKGSGTYIKQGSSTKDLQQLKNIFDTAYNTAIQSGFSHGEIFDFFISGLLEKSHKKPGLGKVILIDCNYPVLEDLDRKIKQECDIDSHFMLIQDIISLPGKFVKRTKEYNSVVCGMNHLEELTSVVPDIAKSAMTFTLTTDFEQIHQIISLSSNTAVGYCCLTTQSAQAFFNNLILNKNWNYPPLFGGITQTESLKKMMNDCDIIFATHYAYDRVLKQIPEKKKVQKVQLDIDPSSFDFLISQLKKDFSTHG